MGDYNPELAWPLILDNFVEWIQEKQAWNHFWVPSSRSFKSLQDDQWALSSNRFSTFLLQFSSFKH